MQITFNMGWLHTVAAETRHPIGDLALQAIVPHLSTNSDNLNRVHIPAANPFEEVPNGAGLGELLVLSGPLPP